MCEHSKRVWNQMWKRVIAVRAVGWKLAVSCTLISCDGVHRRERLAERRRSADTPRKAREIRATSVVCIYAHTFTQICIHGLSMTLILCLAASPPSTKDLQPPHHQPAHSDRNNKRLNKSCPKASVITSGQQTSRHSSPSLSSSLSLSLSSKPPYTCPLIETANN